MKYIARAIVTVLLLIVPKAVAEPSQALFLTCDFLERLQNTSWQVVDSRSYAAPVKDPYYFSMGNFTCKVVTQVVNDSIVKLQSTLNSYDKVPRNYFDEKIVMQGASVFFDSVLVRGEAVYRVRITFDSLGAAINDCNDSFGSDDFSSDPSGDFDFYYIKYSLGDYHWNAIRDAFEYDYDKIVAQYNINERDKIFFYICPCEPTDIGWDKRWDDGYDYARKNVFAKYTHGVNRLYPQVVYMVKFMRIWGYAPALLLEGVACSLEANDYFSKEALKQGTLPDLTQLGSSQDYRALDRRLSSSAAGSFVGYLASKYGNSQLQQWYSQATDLTLSQSFAKVYKQPMADIQQEWHSYLDTLTINPNMLEFYVDRAEQFSDLSKMLTFAEAELKVTADSARVAKTLASLYFTFGEYETAQKFVRWMVKSAKGKAKNEKVFLANMMFAEGEVGPAENIYYSVAESDSIVYMTYFKLGQIEYDRGNYKNALPLFKKAHSLTTLPSFVVDSDLWIGDTFRALGEADSSHSYYQDALDRAKLLAASHGEDALNHLAVGRAALRLNSLELAKKHLASALFLEERMFYLGQIFLATGMMYDAGGHRQKALKEYREVLDLPTAYLDRRLAERYIQTPYKN